MKDGYRELRLPATIQDGDLFESTDFEREAPRYLHGAKIESLPNATLLRPLPKYNCRGWVNRDWLDTIQPGDHYTVDGLSFEPEDADIGKVVQDVAREFESVACMKPKSIPAGYVELELDDVLSDGDEYWYPDGPKFRVRNFPPDDPVRFDRTYRECLAMGGPTVVRKVPAQPAIVVPHGYRLLDPEEVVEAGDMFAFDDYEKWWDEVYETEHGIVSIGKTYGDSLKEDPTALVFRKRRIPRYRVLDIGEKLEPGDLVDYFKGTVEPAPVMLFGGDEYVQNHAMFLRPLPKPTSPREGCRQLDAWETVRATDFMSPRDFILAFGETPFKEQPYGEILKKHPTAIVWRTDIL